MVGLLFAAVAAGASVITVALTIEYRRDEQVGRLAGALVALRRIAKELPSYTDTRFAPRPQAFIDAQQEIERAKAVPRRLGLDVHNHVEPLLAADAWRDPKAAAQNAEDAYLWLVAEPPSLMPRWYRHLVSIVPRSPDQHDAADPGSTSAQ